MSALYGILAALVVLAGAAAGYRVWEKRSRRRENAMISPPVIERPIETASTPIEPEVPSAPAEETTVQAEAITNPATESPSAKVPPMEPVIIQDPWLDEPEEDTSEPVSELPAAETPSIPPADSPPVASEASVESGIEIPAVSPPTSDWSAKPASFATLNETLASWGRSGQLQRASSLMRYVNHADSSVRATVATALGNLAANRSGAHVEALIPTLGKLTQDSRPEVCVAAVESLGKLRSPKVLPWLQRSQNHPNPNIKKAAATALRNLKLTYQPRPAKLKPDQRMKGK
ncbi:HEAT repeat domain-containing protein [Leptothermofonsia sp. ETS-13]|uniref:HEAT repeat domain-containing protein n=1 Tax=Leptothermofonsia sp. ETS-13 TaxID=3035696 RepID=UPI003B9F9BAB